VKKLVLLAVSAAAAVSATALSTGVAVSDPAGSESALSVVGEPYGKAVAILKSQGAKAVFGGSVGSDLPQAQCIVDSETPIRSGNMIKLKLMLNCTKAAAAAACDAAPQGSPGPASLGGNGITTVTATPVQGGGGGGPVHPGGT
jgi:hypothetical protein